MNTINFKNILSIFIIFIISGCATIPDIVPQISLPILDKHSMPDERDIEQANTLLAAGKKREAASAYFTASKNYPSPQRERLILQAAELSAIFKDARLTQRYLAPISYNRLNTENQARFRFTQAQLALNDGNYKETLRILPQRVNGLPKALGSKILNARLAAAQASGNRLSLVQELIMQEPMLKNDYEVKLNHDRIWNHLKQMSLQQIKSGRDTTQHLELKGWLALAAISKTPNIDKSSLKEQLTAWSRKYPNHPGNNKITTILNSTSSATVTPYQDEPKEQAVNNNSKNTSTTPKLGGIKPAPSSDDQQNIAVILPLTGNLSSIGNTLLKGIKEAQEKYANNIRLKVYNSSTSSIEGLYQTAVDRGADFIIGPFNKAKIVNLKNINLTVPTLGLNYVSRTSKNFYQFGLSPEDEAVQMAQYTMNKGQKRIAILAPASAWGMRVQNAIRTAVIERGGKIIVIESYQNVSNSYLPTAKRVAKLTNELDAILIAASPSQARILYPNLRQVISRLPIYATSHVFNGIAAPHNDAQLDGLIYTETPWILDMLRQNITPKTSFPRLHAMGMDALLIATQLPKLDGFGTSFKGKTGKIHLSNDGSMHRSLRWAQFKNGIPVPY